MTKKQSSSLHRGRIQSQGGPVNDSEPWTQSTPLHCTDGVSLSRKLEARHNASERALRSKVFDDARRFMQNASQHGGVLGHTSKSFYVRGDQAARRVDIEVQNGTAFI
jgi:hypothetical protein